jgi:hypothetical protein
MPNYFFLKSCRVSDVKKNDTAGQAKNDKTAHALCVLDDEGYKHTHRTCSTYSFFHSNNGCTDAPQFLVIRIHTTCLVKILLIQPSYAMLITIAHVFCYLQAAAFRVRYVWCDVIRWAAVISTRYSTAASTASFIPTEKKVKSHLSTKRRHIGVEA